MDIKTFSGLVLFSLEGASLKETLEKAVAGGADLRGADLRGANLRGADLEGANLSPIKNVAKLDYGDLPNIQPNSSRPSNASS